MHKLFLFYFNTELGTLLFNKKMQFEGNIQKQGYTRLSDLVKSSLILILNLQRFLDSCFWLFRTAQKLTLSKTKTPQAQPKRKHTQKKNKDIENVMTYLSNKKRHVTIDVNSYL